MEREPFSLRAVDMSQQDLCNLCTSVKNFRWSLLSAEEVLQVLTTAVVGVCFAERKRSQSSDCERSRMYC